MRCSTPDDLFPRTLFASLKYSTIECICLAEMEFSAKGVEVSQQDSKLPVSVIASAVIVQTCLGQNAFKLLPHTCHTDGDVAKFASPLAEIGQDEPVLFKLEERLQEGLGSLHGWYLSGLVLAQNGAETVQGLVYLVL